MNDSTRLYMTAMVQDNPNMVMPDSLGDVMWTANYGISYEKPANITLSLLTVPREVIVVEGVNPRTGAPTYTQTAVNKTQRAGKPLRFTSLPATPAAMAM